MLDISSERTSLRYARASGKVFASPEVIEAVKNEEVPQGDVAAVARSAGIQTAKHTSDWIVFCHNLPVEWIDVRMEIEEDGLRFIAEARTVGKAGVEMEAMTAVSAALLNAYDMLKPLQGAIKLGRIRLEEKRGGKADMRDTFDPPLRGALLVVSTAKKKGTRPDNAGAVIRSLLEDHPVELVADEILSEDRKTVKRRLVALTDREGMDLIFLCGGTGAALGDFVPALVREVSDKLVLGIGEAMRQYGFQRTPFAMLSDQVAGIRGDALIVALPGSSRGAQESLQALLPGLLHIFPMMRAG